MRYDEAKYKLTSAENATRIFQPSTLVWLTDTKALMIHDGLTPGGGPLGDGSGGGTGTPLISPGTAAPNGFLVGAAKGQNYSQLAAGGTYKLRDWVFNGTPGTNTGWL